MTPLDLQSERFCPTGNLASEGVLNTLGRPRINPLSLLIRETVQNSWDARADEAGGVRFTVAGWMATREQRSILRDVVFARRPPHLGLAEALAGTGPMPLLAIVDRGTVGLGGPTRADVMADGRRDFVDLLRNVGQPPDRERSGGTYGYGKAVLYLTSQVNTICVDTRCAAANGLERRFLGAAVGRQYRVEQGAGAGLFTGRHWWGREREGIVEPILNEEATDLAAGLGLPDFAAGECGTSLLVLCPDFGGRAPEQAMQVMAESLLWYFWPKMLRGPDGHAAMQFSLSWEHSDVRLPDPEAFPPLDGYVRAYRRLEQGEAPREDDGRVARVVAIECQRPRQRLGTLALHRFPARPRAPLVVADEIPPAPFEGASHHVALMRGARLVVRYLEGPSLPTPAVEYGGVFITDAEVDDAYARSEPPTHDEWTPDLLRDQRERRYVRVGLRRITDELVRFASPPPAAATATDGGPLGAFAERLGDLLPGVEGPGASVEALAGADGQAPGNGRTAGGSGSAGGGGSSRRSARPQIRLLEEPRLALLDGRRAMVLTFRVEHEEGSAATRLRLRAGVILDNNELERDPPAAGAVPVILSWTGSDGQRRSGSEEAVIPATDVGTWEVAVTVPDDTIAGVELEATPEEQP